MNALFFLIPSILVAWGLYCLRKGIVWVRTREPRCREEVGEIWYVGINAFLVFAGLFAMAALNQISFPPIGSYLYWVFEVCAGSGGSRCRDPAFVLRLAPGYLITVAVLVLLRPKRC